MIEPRTKWLIVQAIQAHQDRHDGEKPLRIEVHPRVMDALRRELGPHPYPRVTPETEPVLFGVYLCAESDADYPCLITCNNEIELI